MNRNRYLLLLIVLLSIVILMLLSSPLTAVAFHQASTAVQIEDPCLPYYAALNSPAGYFVGTVSADLEADLRQAMECANANGTDDLINLDGQIVTLDDAPAAYNWGGYNGLPPVEVSGSLIIKNGTIERSANLSSCTGVSEDRTKFRLLLIWDDAEVTLQNLTLRNGCACWPELGGYKLFGGAILNEGTLRLNAVHITGNKASYGAAIRNTNTLIAANSSFVNNTVIEDLEPGYGSVYAQIWGAGGAGANSTFVNSTFSTNSAPNDRIIDFNAGNSLKLINTTFSENTAVDVLETYYTAGSMSIDIHNTIFVNNSANTCNSNLGTYATLSATGSFSDDASCTFSALGGTDNADIQLGALATAANGTQYYPVTGGETLHGGDNSLLPTETELGIDVDQDGEIEDDPIWQDQRGGWRTWDAAIDAGSYELSCADYYPGLNSAYGYVVGSTLSDLETDLYRALRCAFDPPMVPVPHPVIDLGGQTITVDSAPMENDKDGQNAIFPIWRGPFTLKNGTIERSAALTTCDGGEGDRTDFRLLHVSGSEVTTLQNLTLRNGCAAEVDGGSDYDTFGGALFNGGNILHMNNVHFEGNSGGQGAAFSSGPWPLVAVNSSFVGNNWNGSGDHGAILYLFSLSADVTLVNSTVSQNDAADQSIIWVDDPYSSLHIVNSTLVENTASQLIGSDALWAYDVSFTFHNTVLANSSGVN